MTTERKVLPSCMALSCMSNLLKVLANRDRLLLLLTLSEKEYCVSELESTLHIRQPTLSQQLSVLRNADLVRVRRDGRSIFYALTDERVQELMEKLKPQLTVN